MNQTFLVEFGIVLVVATFFGVIARLLKQPLILAYLVAGVIIGPFALGLVKDYSVIETFSSIGIIFLLFLIGLELNPRKLLEVGGSALTVGIGQILFSGLLYYLVATTFGYKGIGGAYLALALTFSSTAIIVTLLSNKNDLDSLYGKILVGVLLIQDFVAVILLTVASGIHSVGAENMFYKLTLGILVKAVLLFLLTYLVSRYLLPPIMHRIARSQELLFLSSLAWCFFLAVSAVSLGFSAEIGAFLAGVSLAPLPFSPHIAVKTKPLRDFFITIFFIYLGTTLVFTDIVKVISPAIVFALLVMIFNPIIVITIMSALGYRKRTSFVTGITLTQISEFSFIAIALGIKLQIVPKEIGTLVSLVAIITVFVSTYLISNANKIYHYLRPYLGFIDSGEKRDYLTNISDSLSDHVVLIGYHRMGKIVYEQLIKMNEKVAVIDVDPRQVQDLISEGGNCIYGDAVDHDIVEHIDVDKAKLIISTIDKFEESELIISTYKKVNRKLKFIMVANGVEEATELYRAGADLVIVPTYISGDHLSHLLSQINTKAVTLEKLKERGMKTLEEYSQ